VRKLAWFLVPFFFVAACAVAVDAHAQTACPTGAVANDAARVCWRNATLMADGATIPTDPADPLALKSTQVSYGKCTATDPPDLQSLTTVPATIGFVLYEALEPATWCFRARHELNNGTWGNFTGFVRKTTTAPAPAKPKPPSITVG
jgi:hypothetical protein